MAREPDDRLRQGVAAAVILQLASMHPAESDKLRAALLKVAAAAVELAEMGQGPNAEAMKGLGETASSALQGWTDTCAELLTAMSYPLAGIKPALEGTPPPVTEKSLAALAEQLAAQTNKTHDALAGLCGSLRSSGGRLLQRAGQFGALNRALQQERIRLKEDLERTESAQRELEEVRAKRGDVAKVLERLEERLRLATAAPEECRRLERQVKAAEEQAKEYEKQLKPLQEKLGSCQEQIKSLPERIAQTQHLMEELEKSSDRKLLEGIEQIWRQLQEAHRRNT